MSKNTYRLLVLVILLAVGVYAAFWKLFPKGDEAYEQSTIPTELNGQVLHWRYDEGDSEFRVEMHSEELHFARNVWRLWWHETNSPSSLQ